jgi:hypothetical protein
MTESNAPDRTCPLTVLRETRSLAATSAYVRNWSFLAGGSARVASPLSGFRAGAWSSFII